MDVFGLVLFTVIIFGQFIAKSKHVWNRKAFWVFCGIGFVVHALICAALFRKGGEVSGGRWLLLVSVELFVLIYTRQYVFGPTVRNGSK